MDDETKQDSAANVVGSVGKDRTDALLNFNVDCDVNDTVKECIDSGGNEADPFALSSESSQEVDDQNTHRSTTRKAHIHPRGSISKSQRRFSIALYPLRHGRTAQTQHAQSKDQDHH